MLKKIICIVVLWLAFLSPAYAQQSLVLGGGGVSPHTEDSDTTLDDGWSLFAAVDHRFYEENGFKFAGGIMFIYANYDDSGNVNDDSYLFFLYGKPSIQVSDFMLYLIGGVGTDSEYYDGLTGLVGAGLDWNFYNSWSAGISTLHAENNERKYRMKYMFTVKYDF
jgi:hypothetical protein